MLCTIHIPNKNVYRIPDFESYVTGGEMERNHGYVTAGSNEHDLNYHLH